MMVLTKHLVHTVFFQKQDLVGDIFQGSYMRDSRITQSKRYFNFKFNEV